MVEISSRLGSKAQVMLHGGHVVSWRNPAGTEQLYMSPRAVFEPGKAIRGGVPIIFPQFGPGPLPTHGFARMREWKLVASSDNSDSTVSITLALESSPETLDLWPHNFRAALSITLGESLSCELTVTNTGTMPLTFQCAFHSYFPVSLIAQARIHGLEQLPYLNNLRGRMLEDGTPAPLMIDQEIDRVYPNVPNPTLLEDLITYTQVEISKQGLADVVIWNPWVEKSKSLKDLEPDGYLRFVCIETGAIATPLLVTAGGSTTCGQRLRVLRC